MARPDALEMHPNLLDAQYPEMKAWASAGVEQSAFASTDQESGETVRLKPSDDLIAAASQSNRTLILAPGVYALTQPLIIADQVLIRGAGFGRTRLTILLREQETDESAEYNSRAGIVFASSVESGLENLTIVMDESLIPPIDPSAGPYAYDNNPEGQNDLYITMIRFEQSRNSWLKNCELRNAGTHPLVIRQSQHITIENSEIIGSYNKSKGFGTVTISGSEFCLLRNLRITDINHLVFREGSHHNVVQRSHLIVDIRFFGHASDNNLIENSIVTVPSWHHTPPITHVVNDLPGPSNNLVYFCTITRNFPTANIKFSVADNPNEVYRVLKSTTRESSVEVAGPAPAFSTLWPVRAK